ARDAVPRRGRGVAARRVSKLERDESRYAQVLRFPNRRELARRFPPLVTGILIIGFSISISVRAQLGLAAWDVFHQGVAKAFGLSTRAVVVVVGRVVLVACVSSPRLLGAGTRL